MKALTCAVLMVTLAQLVVSEFQWKQEGEVVWSEDCDFYGSDFELINNVDAKACRVKCHDNSRCVYLTFSRGACFLKDNRGKNIPDELATGTGSCGVIPSRETTKTMRPISSSNSTSDSSRASLSNQYAIQAILFFLFNVMF